MAIQDGGVGELPGLYGPFSMSERVVQKIWLRRDFASDGVRLADGRELRIKSVGTWNLLGGPDFKGARLEIAGGALTGDVEVHFRASDWAAHGHAANPTFSRVVLHVVLFPQDPGAIPAVDHLGRELPTLVLLPLLNRGLEEYAADDALERLTDRDAIERVAGLAGRPLPELAEMLLLHASKRWHMKVRFAEVRIAKLGWTDAAHHAALEVLGYRRNRAPMLATATAHPLLDWIAGLDPAALLAERHDAWETHGVRPANQPRTRLVQYGNWVRACPDWPDRLRTMMSALRLNSPAARPTADVRRALDLPTMRTRVVKEVLGNSVGGSRIDTLICDGFLPLVAVGSPEDFFAAWFHWFMGDLPDGLRAGLRAVGVVDAKSRPFCHGWGQGLLGWMVDRDARASR